MTSLKSADGRLPEFCASKKLTMRNLAQRLKRLETIVIPATPNILTMRVISAATGQIVEERRLEFYARNYRGRRTTWAARREPASPQLFD